MEASNTFASNEPGDDVQKEVRKVATIALFVKIFGKVLLAGIGFFIGWLLGFVVALYAGWINIGC